MKIMSAITARTCHSHEAARLVMIHRQNGTFSELDYELFINSDLVRNVKSAEKELFNNPDVSNAYSELLAKLRVDVLFSAMSKTAQSVATVKSQVKTSLPTSMELTFCRSRVSSLLTVEPFDSSICTRGDYCCTR